MGNIGDSGYTFSQIYSYKGRTTYHYVYAVYPDDTEWGQHQHGSYPHTKVAQWNLDDRSDRCGPKSVTFTSKFNNRKYKVTASRCTKAMVWSWLLVPEGAIDKLEYPSTVDPNELAYVYAYIKNTGGEGEFKVSLMEGDIRIASESKRIPANETVRLTLIARMPAKDWHLRTVLEESGVVRDSEEFVISKRICTEGEKRNPKTCWDSSTIQGEVCRNNAWVPTGETCPVKVCTEGEKRSPKTCWDDSTIQGEVCRNNAWVPTGETCPQKPECTEGDKKAGYVCVGGKWQTAPAVPEPVVPPVTPPVTPPKYLTPEQADERIRAGLPCYIKCVLPLLDALPGIPYTPGMWVPTFCAITTEQ